MEILKFAEPPKRSSRSNTKKSGGLMPLLAVVVSVAVVGGMSTTLAGTISLNSGGSVEFGQGVVTTAACDTTIKILPTSTYDSSSVSDPFKVSDIKVADIGISGGSDTATYGAGCLGKRLTLRAYKSDGTPLNLRTGQAFIYVEIPESATVVNSAPDGTPNDKNNYSDRSADISISEASGFVGTTGDANTGYFVISNLTLSGAVTKITLESSEAS